MSWHRTHAAASWGMQYVLEVEANRLASDAPGPNRRQSMAMNIHVHSTPLQIALLDCQQHSVFSSDEEPTSDFR